MCCLKGGDHVGPCTLFTGNMQDRSSVKTHGRALAV